MHVTFMDPPMPADQEWARRTMTMLWEADCAAREEWGLPVRDRRAFRVDANVRKGRALEVAPQGRRPGACAGCGCHYDDLDPGCAHCRVRHAVRRHLKRRRLEASSAGAFAAVGST